MSLKIVCEKSVTRQRSGEQDSRLLSYANENRNKGFFNDVELSADDECISANQMVLSCYSKYFENIFKTNLYNQQRCIIENVDGKSLKILINYIYTGNVEINNRNALNLLSAADKLKIQDVKMFCLEFLETVITYDSCFHILSAAQACQSFKLQFKVFLYLNENFEKVLLTPPFKALTKTEVTYCMTRLNRDVVSETTLYDAIIAWIKYDEENRRKDFSDLFQLLKLEEFSHDFLMNVVSKEKFVSGSSDCLNMILKVFPKVLDLRSQNEFESRILSIGGCLSPSKVFEVFKLHDEPPKQYPDLPMPLSGHCSIKMDNFIYCLGGVIRIGDNRNITNKAWRLNLDSDHLKWEEIAAMTEKRRSMRAAVCFNTLVVSHGDDAAGSVSTTTEIYQKSLDQWKIISSLQQHRESHALVAFQEKLYAIAGCCYGEVLSSVEVLSGLDSTWKYVKSLQTPRKWFAAVSCRGFIYVIGGFSEYPSRKLKSVERYNSVANKWDYVADMTYERSAHSACVLQGKIYVDGGLDSEKSVVNKVECYDPSCDKWILVDTTENNLYNHTLVVV